MSIYFKNLKTDNPKAVIWYCNCEVSFNMLRPENTTLVRYEFDAYVQALDSSSDYKICNILLTEDDLSTKRSQGNEINWVNVENIDVVEIETSCNDSFAETKKRICGIFETKPVDWKYAKITVNDNTNTRRFDAIAKMPRSPVIPVIFDFRND
jgi:hypothetical protein